MRTHRLLTLLIGTLITGSMAGCGSQVAQGPPPPPPQIDGYDDRYWVWDEEDGEWEYEPPGGGSGYFYGGKLHKSSIRSTSGYKSSSKIGGFGSGSKGGGFGG